MKLISVTYEVVVPEPPDMLQLAGREGIGVPVSSITKECLVDIGDEWTRELLEKAGYGADKLSYDPVSPVLDPAKIKRAGKAKKRKGKSNYKGVSRLGKKWRAQVYDKVLGKSVHLGSYDSELLAAAAYQEHIGNKKEAKRLRNEYKEGNCMPERHDDADTSEKIEQLKGPVTYMCSQCGESYEKNPKICRKCDSGAIEPVRLQAAMASHAQHQKGKR